MKKVSIIIPVCMMADSLRMHYDLITNINGTVNREGVEIIVIENGSVYLESPFEAWADKYEKYPEMLGFTKALNRGLIIAKGDYIAQINTDVRHEYGWVDKMVNVCDDNGGLAFGVTYMPSENVENSINGSCWMMKKEVLAKVGPWDETFKHYFSDQDFFIKCKMAGFRLTCVGNMWMGHGGSATYKNIKDKISEDINLERDMMLARYGEINYDNWLNKKNNYV